MSRIRLHALFVVLACSALPAFAEEARLKASADYDLLGTIATDDPSIGPGVALIKSRASNRTIVIRESEPIEGAPSLHIERIEADRVIVADASGVKTQIVRDSFPSTPTASSSSGGNGSGNGMPLDPPPMDSPMAQPFDNMQPPPPFDEPEYENEDLGDGSGGNVNRFIPPPIMPPPPLDDQFDNGY